MADIRGGVIVGSGNGWRCHTPDAKNVGLCRRAITREKFDAIKQRLAALAQSGLARMERRMRYYSEDFD